MKTYFTKISASHGRPFNILRRVGGAPVFLKPTVRSYTAATKLTRDSEKWIGFDTYCDFLLLEAIK